jgi:hypothetical protein
LANRKRAEAAKAQQAVSDPRAVESMKQGGRGEPPAWRLNESIRLGREYLRITGTDEGTLRDVDRWLFTDRRYR